MGDPCTVSYGHATWCLPKFTCDNHLFSNEINRRGGGGCLAVFLPGGAPCANVLGVRKLGEGFTGVALQLVRCHVEVPASDGMHHVGGPHVPTHQELPIRSVPLQRLWEVTLAVKMIINHYF